jgi:peptidyl-prolyl cis-trans isomerase SurA
LGRQALSARRRGDLSLNAGASEFDPRGVNTLHVKWISRAQWISWARLLFPALLLLGGALFWAGAGCHRPPSADVVATVNGKEILRSDLDRYFQASLSDSPQKPSPVEADIRRLQFLHQMIQDEILQQAAAKLNLEATDEDVNARLTELKAPFTQEEFDNQLKQQNMTLDDYKRLLRRQLTTNKLLNKEIESKINITDAQIRDYYNAHKADYDLIEPQYHLATIEVATRPAQQGVNLANKAVSDSDARKKIDEAHSRLQSGDDFGAVAGSYSEDPNTAPNGGDMGFVPESQLRADPEVYDAINKLKPDQITDVLPIYDNGSPTHKVIGYAIYKLISHDPAGQRELTDPRVQQGIHQLLHDSQKQLLQNAYFETLQDEAKVRNYYAEQILRQGAP